MCGAGRYFRSQQLWRVMIWRTVNVERQFQLAPIMKTVCTPIVRSKEKMLVLMEEMAVNKMAHAYTETGSRATRSNFRWTRVSSGRGRFVHAEMHQKTIFKLKATK
jgi:hypothetical protein